MRRYFPALILARLAFAPALILALASGDMVNQAVL